MYSAAQKREKLNPENGKKNPHISTGRKKERRIIKYSQAKKRPNAQIENKPKKKGTEALHRQLV